jgi:hypothetical protein
VTRERRIAIVALELKDALDVQDAIDRIGKVAGVEKAEEAWCVLYTLSREHVLDIRVGGSKNLADVSSYEDVKTLPPDTPFKVETGPNWADFESKK